MFLKSSWEDGIAATSLVIAYNQYGITGSANHPQTKNLENFQKYSQTSSSQIKNGKSHEDAAKLLYILIILYHIIFSTFLQIFFILEFVWLPTYVVVRTWKKYLA